MAAGQRGRNKVGESDDTLSRLLADLPGGVVAVDSDGVVRFANAAAIELLGQHGNVGETLGLPMTAGGYLELRTDPARIVEIQSAPSSLAGEDVTVLLLHDVTDFESSRTRLQENIDAFEFALGIAAHELRNPLAVLLAALDTLVERGGAIGEKEMSALHPRMRWHANRMRVLVDNTLAVTSGGQHLQTIPEPTDTVAAVRACLRHAAQPDQFELTAADDVPRAWVTPRHLEQILLNLVSNAEKYGTPPFEVTVACGSDHVEVRVRDHGRGVPVALQEQIFDRYTRADADGRAAGTGLGLWVCRELARRNRGDIRHEPADPGAIFVVTLPMGDTPD